MELTKVIEVVREEISSKNLYQQVKEVTAFHRIQASNGYRDAAMYCEKYLKSLNIDAHIVSYKANGDDFAGSYKLFKEWNIQTAYCDVTYPIKKRVADFSLEPISIIQKSYPVNMQDIEVVLMDRGCEKEAYQDIDFTNKVIFIHEHFEAYTWAVNECGAIGYISDFYNEVPYIRNKEEMQDSLNYTSFWWKHTREEKPAFGFVLSPREGKQLTKLCEEVRNQFYNKIIDLPYIRISAMVDAKLFDGHIDVVEGILPGKKEDTILIVAHLCHPCASANDNASGVSGGMEVLRSLHEAIRKGKLDSLEYTIKLILVPEFTGTYSYLFDGRDTSKIIAGINLDMIGGKQENGYGPITITTLPHALPSFVDMLATLIMQKVKEDNQSVEKMDMSLVNTYIHKFQLGSDHCVLCDPEIHVPTIMLGQWPDKNYHTSTDTIDKIDPIVLKYSTTLAASYVYALANTAFTGTDIILEMRLRFVENCNRIVKEYKDQKNAISYIETYYKECLKELYAYLKQSFDKNEYQNFTIIANMYKNKEYNEEYSLEYQTIPKRLFHSPIADVENMIIGQKDYQTLYREFQKKHPIMKEEHCTLQTICDYYVDGKRTVQEIYECVYAETGISEKEDILSYIQMMKQIQLME